MQLGDLEFSAPQSRHTSKISSSCKTSSGTLILTDWRQTFYWNFFIILSLLVWMVWCPAKSFHPHLQFDIDLKEAQWPIGYGVGLRIKRSSVRIRLWPLRWVLGQGSLLPLSQGEAFTLASISYLAILVKYILAKKEKIYIYISSTILLKFSWQGCSSANSPINCFSSGNICPYSISSQSFSAIPTRDHRVWESHNSLSIQGCRLWFPGKSCLDKIMGTQCNYWVRATDETWLATLKIHDWQPSHLTGNG